MATILVPLDASPLADAALAPAADIARRMKAVIRLVGVHAPALPARPGIAPGAAADAGMLDERCRALLRDHLAEQEGRLREQGLRAEYVLREGRPAKEIAREAETADLVVLSSHGRGGVDRLWLGSVTDELVRRLATPVLVVHAPAEGDPPVSGRFTRVLIPLDGAPEAEKALDTALAVAGTDGVVHTLLRVATPLHPLLMAAATRAEAERDTAEQLEIASQYIAGVAARFATRAGVVKPVVVPGPDPARAILEAAGEHDADLLVLATHAGGAMTRILIGSVADKVLRAARVPVLLQHVASLP